MSQLTFDFDGDEPRPEWTLARAQEWLRARVKKGAECPCCKRFARVYDRKLPSASVRVLIALYRLEGKEGREYVQLPPLLDQLGLSTLKRTAHQGGYATLSHHWALIEAKPGERKDGSKRVGWWRLTDLGREFVLEQTKVSKYARLYGQRLLRVHGEPIGIRDALGNHFDYRELMGWE